MAIYGIDVSKWQTNAIADSAESFVICKATEGASYVDPTCDVKYQYAKKKGKLLGVYHFARPDLGNSAQSEAQFFVKNIKGYLGEAVIVLDWEKSVNNVSWAKAWLDEVFRLTGVRPMIYMSASVVTSYNWSTVAPYYGLWIAGYPAKYNVKNPAKPASNEMPYKLGAWKFAAMWQYTSSAGTLDRDIFYGDATAWKKYAAAPSITANMKVEKEAAKVEQTPEKKDETVTIVEATGGQTTVLKDPAIENKKEPEESTPKNPVSTDAGLTVKEWDDIFAEAVAKTTGIVDKSGFKLNISNKTYDILKLLAVIILPLCSVAYAGLSQIWGFGFGQQVDASITLFISIINSILGLAVVKASSDYKAQ